MGAAQRVDHLDALGGERLAIRDRTRQPVEIVRHAADGVLELRRVLRGKRVHRLDQILALGVERTQRALALGRIGGGEQRLRRGHHFGGFLGDPGGPRHLRQARSGDDAERAPETVIGDERVAAGEHRRDRDGAEGGEQAAAQAEAMPRQRDLLHHAIARGRIHAITHHTAAQPPTSPAITTSASPGG